MTQPNIKIGCGYGNLIEVATLLRDGTYTPDWVTPEGLADWLQQELDPKRNLAKVSKILVNNRTVYHAA